MFEFSTADIVIGLWAAVATAYALEYRKRFRATTFLMQLLVENTEAYTSLREQWLAVKKVVKN